MPAEVTRRSVVTGIAAAAAIGGKARAADVDVVVVGAGAAGLAAAKELRRAGRSLVVVEARPRIGGRAFTSTSLGAPFDAGAQYIHWAERNPWVAIARELQVELREEPDGGRFAAFRGGERLSDAERAARRAAFARSSKLTRFTGRDRSFAEAVRSEPEPVVAAAAATTRLSLGEEPERVSIADYDQLWSGADFITPDGYGTLVARYGADAPVQLDTAVTAIRWGGRAVAVETPRGTLAAQAAIVTVPVGVLQAGSIRFVPDLPPPTRDALAGLRMGAYTKIALKLDRGRLGPVAFTDAFDIGPASLTAFELFPSERDLVIAYLGGDHARGLCEAGEAAAIDYAVERLAAMLGTSVRAMVTAGRLAAWWTHPLSRGCYAVALPGHAGARLALRRPIGDRIWIAGEATAGGAAMTVGGATLEGIRAARAVIAARA